NAVVRLIEQVAIVANQAYGIKLVALSGGCFMNRRLVETSVKALSDKGFEVAINLELPPNDANIAFGQASVVAKRLRGK
ncbi:MAG: hypothetical protein HUJ63_08625, partial [Enterococcus sp.]|nr:hypothetical protein [Enterococcus sp.]